MSSCEVDQGSLMWVLSQKDLTLSWHCGQTACANQSLEEAPVEANFCWMRGDQSVVWSLRLPKEQLEQLIRNLESRGVDVPNAFGEALRNFPPC